MPEQETCTGIIKDAEPLFEARPRKVVTHGSEQMPTFEFGRLDYSFNATLHLPAAATIIDNALQSCVEHYAQYIATGWYTFHSSRRDCINRVPSRP